MGVNLRSSDEYWETGDIHVYGQPQGGVGRGGVVYSGIRNKGEVRDLGVGVG